MWKHWEPACLNNDSEKIEKIVQKMLHKIFTVRPHDSNIRHMHYSNVALHVHMYAARYPRVLKDNLNGMVCT